MECHFQTQADQGESIMDEVCRVSSECILNFPILLFAQGLSDKPLTDTDLRAPFRLWHLRQKGKGQIVVSVRTNSHTLFALHRTM